MKNLIEQLKGANNFFEKDEIISAHPSVRAFAGQSLLWPFLEEMEVSRRFVLKTIIVMGQEKKLFGKEIDVTKLLQLADKLLKVENFYLSIGGLVGYCSMVIKLAQEKKKKVYFHKPKWIDIRKNTEEVQKKVALGLKHLKEFALICPLGGTADRLGFKDRFGKSLPAAELPFLGRSLLEILIRDVEGLEYLCFKTFGEKVLLPLVFMTSLERDNHKKIEELLERNDWFGRPKDNFFLFPQISVPVISKSGNWIIKAPFDLTMKPSGHGALWKEMRDNGVFEWLYSKNIDKALVRQINNPIAGTDFGILALMGYLLDGKKLGFASCPRLENAAEGINVLIEKKKHEYAISNVEYADFAKYEIGNEADFPANTNLFVVDLRAIEEASKQEPLPGLVVNMKGEFSYIDDEGREKLEKAGRLELMMQNIADVLTDSFDKPLKDHAKLNTFLTYNERRKTISTTKRLSEGDKLIEGTPENCFSDFLHNGRDLLSNYCNVILPPFFIFMMHPALGPLYSEIAKKIKTGEIIEGSELQLEIADLLLQNFHLNGSLLIYAKDLTAKCVLKNTKINNLGVNRTAKNCYWRNDIDRKEACKLILGKNSLLEIENLELNGSLTIEVLDNQCKVLR